jgi:hypothetical protein
MEEILKAILQYAVAPLAAFCVYVYKKQSLKVDKLEERVASMETSTAVIKVMVDAIHQDIREIKYCIEKIADRRD